MNSPSRNERGAREQVGVAQHGAERSAERWVGGSLTDLVIGTAFGMFLGERFACSSPRAYLNAQALVCLAAIVLAFVRFIRLRGSQENQSHE